MTTWRHKRANQLALIGAAVLLGTVVARLPLADPGWVMAALGIALFSIGRPALGALAVAALALGFWRSDATLFAKSDLGVVVGQKVVAAGSVTDDAGINDRNQASFTLAVDHLNGHASSGSLRIYTAGYKEVLRGYKVEVRGLVKPAKGSVPAQMSYALVTITDQRRSALERWRSRFFVAARSVLAEPLSGFGLGLLVGVRALIDKPLQDTLNAVGLSHLIAVSGYNLTILIQAVRRLLQPVSTFTATTVSIWLIVGFLLVTGFSASIVRASVVALLSLGASYYGFNIKPITLISLPAALTVLWNPHYLLGDIGWQLSFLAFFGIIVVAPLVTKRLKQPNTIKLLIIESLTAQVVTAPLIMYYFSNLSLVSPVANAVVLPLVPLAMLLSFMVGVVGIFSPPLAAWVALPATGLLGLMIGSIQWFATWPYANTQLSMSLGQMGVAYILIVIATLILSLRAPAEGDTISPDRKPAKRRHYDGYSL